MSEELKIYIDSLQKGLVDKIDNSINISALEISEEKELLFSEPIHLKGKAYIAEDDIILNLDVKFLIKMPCKICNELSEIPVQINNLYHVEELSNVALCFNYKDILREAILLEIPSFIECNNENCPERSNIAKYVKENDKNNKKEDFHFPFNDLNK